MLLWWLRMEESLAGMSAGSPEKFCWKTTVSLPRRLQRQQEEEEESFLLRKLLVAADISEKG